MINKFLLPIFGHFPGRAFVVSVWREVGVLGLQDARSPKARVVHGVDGHGPVDRAQQGAHRDEG